MVNGKGAGKVIFSVDRLGCNCGVFGYNSLKNRGE